MMIHSRPIPWLVFSALFAACSADPEGLRDAGEADASPDAGTEINLPVLTPCPDGWEEVPPSEEGEVATCEPWPGSSPVVMTPCPAGWREVEDDGVVTCDPWPEGGPHECADDEAHFPGEPGCTKSGTECIEDQWAVDLPTDHAVLYVLAGAAFGGEGTLTTPFGSIAEAVDAARRIEGRVIIALSRGTFDECLRLPNEVTLWGACVAETVVACSSPSSDAGTVTIGGRDIVVRNLQLGGQRSGVWIQGGTSYSAHLESVLVDEARVIGVFVSEGELSGRDIVIRGTRSRESDLLWGRGLQAEFGGRVVIERAVIENNRDSGVYTTNAGSHLSLSDAVVRDTLSQEDISWFGVGFDVDNGGEGELSRVVLDSNRSVGVLVIEEGSRLRASDVIVRDTLSREEDGLRGSGMVVQEGGQVEANRMVLEGNRMAGVFALSPDTTLTMNDVVIRDNLSQEVEPRIGRGLQIQEEAHVEIVRAVFDRNRGTSIMVEHTGTVADLRDVLVRDTRSTEETNVHGRGLVVFDGARLTMERAAFVENRTIALIADAPHTVLEVTDIVVRDTRSQESDGFFGRGIGVQDGALLEVNRALIEKNRDVGLFAAGTNSLARIKSVVIRETLARECSTGDCGAYTAGDGLNSLGGARLEAFSFLVTGNHRCGLQLAHGGYYDEYDIFHRADEGGTMDLHDGVVSYNRIGANVQTGGFDIERLMDRVIYIDNDRNLDMSDLPVPDMEDPLADIDD